MIPHCNDPDCADTKAALIQPICAATRQAVLDVRALGKELGGRGPVPHALNVAATHLQDALGQLTLATDHLAALRAASEAHPLRGLGPEDLLTREEVARYLRCHVTDGHGRLVEWVEMSRA